MSGNERPPTDANNRRMPGQPTRAARSSSVDNLTTWDEFLSQNKATDSPSKEKAPNHKPRKASSGKSAHTFLGEQRKSTASSGSNTPTTPTSGIYHSRDIITSSSPPSATIHAIRPDMAVFDESLNESLNAVPIGRPKSVTLSLSGKLPPKSDKKDSKTPPLSPTYKIQQIMKRPTKEVEETKQDLREANEKFGELIEKTMGISSHSSSEADEKSNLKDSRKSNREKEKEKEKEKAKEKEEARKREEEKRKREALEKQQKQERLITELRKIKEADMQRRAARGQPGSGTCSPMREPPGRSPVERNHISGSAVPPLHPSGTISHGLPSRNASSNRLVRSDDAIAQQTIDHQPTSPTSTSPTNSSTTTASAVISGPFEISPPASPPPQQTRPSPRRGNAMGVSEFFTSAVSPSRSRNTEFSVIPITSSEHSFALAELLSRSDLFTSPDCEDNIVYTRGGDGQIESATIEKLVEKLAQDSTEMRFVFTFLLTYRYVLTSDQLLVLIFARYNTPPPPTVTDVEQWKATKLKPVRIRVLNVLRHWLEKFPKDWTPELLNTLSEWIDSCSDHTPTPSAVLGRILGRIRAQRIQSVPTHLQVLEHAMTEESTQPPKPQLPPGVSPTPPITVDICDLPALELARQLTICDWILMRRIEPKEFLEKRWQSEDRRDEAANLLTFIDHFNAVSTWVVTELLFEETIKSRAGVLAKMIHTAEQLKVLRNFAGFMEIVSGLKQPAVQRLQETWAALPSKTSELWEQLSDLASADASYSMLRSHIAAGTPPTIPHFAILLQDLIYTEEGNPVYARDNRRLVNFTKMRRMADIISKVIACQEKPYALEPLPAVQDFLCSLPSKRQLNPDEQMEISFMREDRKKKHVHSQSGTHLVHPTAGSLVSMLSLSLPVAAPPLSSPSLTSQTSLSTSSNFESGI